MIEYGNVAAAVAVVGASIVDGKFYSADRKSVVAAGYLLPDHVAGSEVVVRRSEIYFLFIHLCDYYSAAAAGFAEAIHQKHQQYLRHRYLRHV